MKAISSKEDTADEDASMNDYDPFSNDALAEFCGFDGVGGFLGDYDEVMTDEPPSSHTDDIHDVAGGELVNSNAGEAMTRSNAPDRFSTEDANNNPNTNVQTWNEDAFELESTGAAFALDSNVGNDLVIPMTGSDDARIHLETVEDFGDWSGFANTKNDAAHDENCGVSENVPTPQNVSKFLAFNDAATAADEVTNADPNAEETKNEAAPNENCEMFDNATQQADMNDFEGFSTFIDAPAYNYAAAAASIDRINLNNSSDADVNDGQDTSRNTQVADGLNEDDDFGDFSVPGNLAISAIEKNDGCSQQREAEASNNDHFEMGQGNNFGSPSAHDYKAPTPEAPASLADDVALSSELSYGNNPPTDGLRDDVDVPPASDESNRNGCIIAEAAEEVEIAHDEEHQFIYDGERNSKDDMDQPINADSGIESTCVGETAPIRFEFEEEEFVGDDAGIAGPNVESATDAIDTVVDEAPIPPGQTANIGGDYTCGSDGDDFGGFASFGEEIPSTMERGEEGPKNFEPTDARSDEVEEADFGGFASFEDNSCLASSDVQDKNDVDTPSNEDQSRVENKSGGVGDGFSYNEDYQNQNQTKQATGIPCVDDDDFGDFGDFEGVRSTSINQNETEEVAQGENQPEEDFGDFEEVPPTLTNENETEQVVRAENRPEPAPGINSMDDGGFGEFAEMQPTPMNENDTEEVAQGESHPEPASGMSSVADEDFGDFGSFEEVPSKSINHNDTENSSTAGVTKQMNQDAEKQPEMATGISSLDDDDFGDFEEVSSTINQRQDGKTSESLIVDASTPTITVLDESVRVMFQTVFAADGQVQSAFDGKESSKLPFDVTLRSVLPNEPTMEETPEESCTHSEEGLAKIKGFLIGLPMSPPIAILSNEKWYPYSHYIFNSDGTPIVESCEPVSPTPSVPDVLCIDLPTGFDASEFSKPSNRQLPEVSISQQKPTGADLPVKNYHEDKKTQRLFDESQLSPAGKKFLDQIPDLSYMLSSSLRLPSN